MGSQNKMKTARAQIRGIKADTKSERERFLGTAKLAWLEALSLE